KDEPLLAQSLSAQRRQAVMPLVVATLGILLAVGFLYLSRARLVQATTTGRIGVEERLNSLLDEKKSIVARKDLNQLPAKEQEIEPATATLKDWQERERFAKDISMMNAPIFMLNCVLVLTAFTASYCAAKPRITEGRLVDPVIPELKSKLVSY